MDIRTTPFLCATLLLAACGSGSGVVSINSNTGFSQIYPSNYLEGTALSYGEIENGLVVYMGGQDGTVSEFHVQLDRMGTPDDATDDALFVQRNGGPTVRYDVTDVTWDDGTKNLIVGAEAANGDEFSLSTYILDSFIPVSEHTGISASYADNNTTPGDTIRSVGGGGLETARNDLPSEATYRGEYALFSAASDIEILGGSTLVVEFANGRVSGTHRGDMDVGGVTGTYDGRVNGTRMGGTMSMTGDATGNLEFAGIAIGEGASRVVLGIGGTVVHEGTEKALGGQSILFITPFPG